MRRKNNRPDYYPQPSYRVLPGEPPAPSAERILPLPLPENPKECPLCHGSGGHILDKQHWIQCDCCGGRGIVAC